MLFIVAAQWGLVFGWKAIGMPAAGNVLQFWLWFEVAAGVSLLFTKPRAPIAPKSRLRSFVARVSTLAMIAALAWFAHFVLAAFYAIAQACIAAHYAQYGADGLPLEKEAA
jgi:hypothetical protein